MSLINDALRKARQAAVEHDEGKADSTFRVRPSHPRRGSRLSGIVFAILIAVVAAVLGAAGAWWFTSRPRQAVAPTSTSDAAPNPTATPLALVAPSETEPTPEPKPVADDRVAIEDRTPLPEPITTEAPPEIEAEPTSRPDSNPTTDAQGRRVYVMDAQIGQVTLSLGYIVARSQNPFAEINGRDVYVGSQIEGFEVEAIEAERVILRNDEGVVVLRIP